ncbi:head-tail connector protein [Paraburkholderia bannensis]|uniref:head-tail connector protein n=1 Tax=Paraburkholderia bannensis TaxID=765414 RepID=UPI002AC33E90|nr:head-tail connector protein [Paraburkholderia bannensis]
MSGPLMLVTIAEAKDWLRADTADLDADLKLAIAGASASIMDYLKRDPYPAGEVPENVRLATLLYVGIMIRDPDGVESAQWEHGYIPRAVMNILYPLRDPALE